ncbi:MAG: GNAT family protein [Oscillospiraceae bacterium]|nr:GNAT family protein [Oscillospiraceae bacterium]
MICGEKTALRAVEKEDLPYLMEWRNRPEYRQYFREYRELNLQNQEQWFNNCVVNDRNTVMFTIVKNDETHERLGCCGLCYINWVQRFADLSLYIGWNNAYIDKEGYAQEACGLLFDYGFQELGLHKIWTEIYEFDTPKQELYLQLGFQQDGLLRENYFHKGKWWNSRIMSLLEQDHQSKKGD